MTTGPKVRDFTAPEQALTVQVEASPVYELLLSLFVWGAAKDTPHEYEIDSEFFEQLGSISTDAIKSEEQLVGGGEIWLPLVGLAHATHMTQSVSSFIDHLASMDPLELRTVLIDGACSMSDVSDEDAAAAAAGDAEAIARIAELKHAPPGFLNLLEAGAVDTQKRIVATLTAVNDALERPISDTLPALRRDADEKRSLARSMDAPKLVETATNGVTFKMQPQVTGVVLIPSKIVRPWTVIIEHGGAHIFAYSVADEHLHADPDAPPSYLVELYKALSDERRLRMLAILNEGDMGLMEIAERVDLAKSTAHHHLRILRSAGLVRVTVGETKSYSLRRDRIPEAGRLLGAFLTTPAGAAENAPAMNSERN